MLGGPDAYEDAINVGGVGGDVFCKLGGQEDRRIEYGVEEGCYVMGFVSAEKVG